MVKLSYGCDNRAVGKYWLLRTRKQSGKRKHVDTRLSYMQPYRVDEDHSPRSWSSSMYWCLLHRHSLYYSHWGTWFLFGSRTEEDTWSVGYSRSWMISSVAIDRYPRESDEVRLVGDVLLTVNATMCSRERSASLSRITNVSLKRQGVLRSIISSPAYLGINSTIFSSAE